MMINIALIGTGYWGKKYISLFSKFKNINFEIMHGRDYKSIRNHIEGVIICTPSNTHYQIAKFMLESNKDVLVEKPLSQNSFHVKELINLANIKQKILMVGHIYMHDPQIYDLKDEIQDIDLQEIYFKRLSNYKYKEPLWELGIHDIYLNSFFLNSSNNKFIKSLCMNDHMFIHLKTGNINSFIEVSTTYPKKTREIFFKGKRGEIFFEYKYNEKPSPLENELSHFIDCIKTRKKPITSGEDSLKTILTIEKILK